MLSYHDLANFIEGGYADLSVTLYPLSRRLDMLRYVIKMGFRALLDVHMAYNRGITRVPVPANPENTNSTRDPFIRNYLLSEVSTYRVDTKENFFEYIARVMLQNGDEMEFIAFLLTPVAATSLLLNRKLVQTALQLYFAH